ncbi:MAG: alpha/beta fold hydrolase, partial [Microthrixaceae bacterium]
MTPSRRARAARLAPACLLLAPAFLLLAACGDGGDPGAAGADRDTSAETVLGDPPEASGFPAGWSAPPLDWDRCDDPSGASPEGGGPTGAMQCATLEVPLDWALPDGEQIELTLARRLATGTRIGSLLTNPGGPGGSGVDFLAAQPLGAELHESFDVVSWDPRGVGRSTGLDCDDRADDLYAADPTPDDAGEAAAIEEVAAGIASDCAESGGDLLAHMNTEEVARDLEAIRLALGGEKLNYLGFSYGTHIGQEYAELFGDRVRAMALDGVVDPSLGFEDFLLGQAEAFEAAFGRQADACASAGIASCGVEDLGAAYDTVLRAAESAAPGTTTADGGDEPTPAEVALAATYTGYLPEGWRQLGPALSDALDGEPGPLRSLAASYVSLADYGPYAAVVCT